LSSIQEAQVPRETTQKRAQQVSKQASALLIGSIYANGEPNALFEYSAFDLRALTARIRRDWQLPGVTQCIDTSFETQDQDKRAALPPEMSG
jgi:hypothetical protein